MTRLAALSRYLLHVHCRLCGHSADIPIPQLGRPDAELAQIIPRFRCRRCRSPHPPQAALIWASEGTPFQGLGDCKPVSPASTAAAKRS